MEKGVGDKVIMNQFFRNKVRKILTSSLFLILLISAITIIPDLSAQSQDEVHLEIVKVDWPNKTYMNKETVFSVKLKNNGENISRNDTISIIFSVGNKNISTIDYNKGLKSGENCSINVSWEPSVFGGRNLRFVMKYNNTRYDNKSRHIFVEPYRLPWWDNNWHYRSFVRVNSSGNISYFFNFTKLLNNKIGVENNVFENQTLRIIQYGSDGTISTNPVVKKFCFNETSSFDNQTNAAGYLSWNTSNFEEGDFYAIYFDVKNNTGIRGSINETYNMSISKNVSVTNESVFTEGWWARVSSPIENSYYASNQSIIFYAATPSKIKQANINLFYNDTKSHCSELKNVENNVSWKKKIDVFNKTGSWNVNFSFMDDAGYVFNDSCKFYVETTDITFSDVNISTDYQPTSPKVYLGDTVFLKASIKSFNARVSDLKIELLIDDQNVETKKTDIHHKHNDEKGIWWSQDIVFEWKPDEIRVYNYTLRLDPDDELRETNESNNHIQGNITVHEWPDMGIKKITVSSKSVFIEEKIDVSVSVENYSPYLASKYKLSLYSAQHSDVFDFNNSYSKKTVSLEPGEQKTFNFKWMSQNAGKWKLAGKIETNNTKKDSYIDNNLMIYSGFINIYGKSAPNIILTDVASRRVGEPITISALVSDEDGVKSVKIDAYTPDDSLCVNNQSMIPGGDNNFSFVLKPSMAGVYSYKIKAVDNSYISNKAVKQSTFRVLDDTAPSFLFYEIKPEVQLVDEEIKAECIVFDNTELKNVEIKIYSRGELVEEKNLAMDEQGKYVYSTSFSTPNRYRIWFEAVDDTGNHVTSPAKYLWITTDLSDTDNDGMPDWWEEKYGFNPKNSLDAEVDYDGDGLSNLEEYKAEGDPTEKVVLENMLYRVKGGFSFLVFSTLMMLVLLFLSYYGYRKRRRFL
ncbi:MAG: CARDB domain-containing protein [Candidatus Thermoplasmatota archaeon]